MPVGAWGALAVAWLTLAVLSLVARLGPGRLVRGSFIAAPFLLAALPVVFTRTADPLGTLPLGPVTLRVSGEGLTLFLTIALKSWVSVQAALLLTFTTRVDELVEGLRLLHMPRIIVTVVGFMIRYLAVLFDEAARMLRARAARSADPTGRGGGSLRWRAAVVGGMTGALFLRSFERSERVYAAMQARGFEGEFRYLPRRALGGGELIAFGLALGAIAVFEAVAHGWIPLR